MRIRVPEDQNEDGLPVGRLNAAAGVRVAVSASSSAASEPLPAGVYLISCTAPIFLSTGASPVAGDTPGSLLLGPGGVLSLALGPGERIAARAVDVDGAVLAVPLTAA